MPPFSQTIQPQNTQPSPPASSNSQMSNNLQIPALSLYPYSDTFIPKHIFLSGKVKIGRQTNAKTVPGERNGYFDSKVLSRQHAEVWEDNGKIYIKDVKSSNGTFVNGERLSPEGVESDPTELKTNDIVEFGIDIVGDDNKTIIHHKVSARVVCILTAEDAMHEQQQMAASAAAAHQHQQSQSHHQHFAQQTQHPAARRPSLQPSLGGMGGPSRPKSSISFDHVLIRLQGELSRSRDTTSELHGLTEAMNEISDALGGAVPPPPVPANLPPVRPNAVEPAPTAPLSTSPSANEFSPSDLSTLHSQLSDTRNSLATHAERVREIEGVLVEHETMKRELAMLRELMEARDRREMELADSSSARVLQTIPEEMDDDDDVRSIRTIVPGDDEDHEDAGHRAVRPGTPEPGLRGYDEEDSQPTASKSSASVVTVDDTRLNELTLQLESAIELSKSLAAQHTVAQETIRQLEERVKNLGVIEERVIQLESAVKSVQEAQATPPTPPTTIPSPESTTSDSGVIVGETTSHSLFESRILELITSWKEDLDGRWSGMQEDWESERRRLNSAKEEFEKRTSGLEEGLGNVRLRVDSLAFERVSRAVGGANRHGRAKSDERAKGEIRHGLVTPPSPRSMSVDSQRKRKPRSRGGTGGGSKRRPSRDSLSDSDAPSLGLVEDSFRPGIFTNIRTKTDSGVGFDAEAEVDGEDSASNHNSPDSKSIKKKRGSGSTGSTGSGRSDSSGSAPSSTAFEEDFQEVFSRVGAAGAKGGGKLGVPPLTPESSILREKLRDRDRNEHPQHLTNGKGVGVGNETHQTLEMTPSTLLGCVIVAAAAGVVYWRTHEG